jgi:hypothetical protein
MPFRDHPFFHGITQQRHSYYISHKKIFAKPFLKILSKVVKKLILSEQLSKRTAIP